MAALRRVKRVGKRASKFQFSATYQSIVIECQNDKWTPHMIAVAFHRRGRRILSKMLPWLPSPDNPLRGLVLWSDPETVEAPITLYKGPKDKTFETKEWDFSIINIDKNSHRKVLATLSVNLVQYASSLPYEHELQLKLRPVSCKIKKVLLEVSLSSVLLKEGKATDDDMISIASMMSVSNLSTIGNLEDDEDYTINRFVTGRSISPAIKDEAIPSTEKLLEWSQEITKEYSNIRVMNMTTSWRNGLAFCAIIHHYRPDLLDYDELTPQSIKENNRLAFTIAQELGIACPLTPNMMLLYDIPDKLAVSSFVYQMYNYFTKAVHSAITKPSPTQLIKGISPSSPPMSFDISKFEEFNIRPISPDGTVPSTRLSGGNIYSRHNMSRSDTPTGGVVNESSSLDEIITSSDMPTQSEGVATSDMPTQSEGVATSGTPTQSEGVAISDTPTQSEGLATFDMPTQSKAVDTEYSDNFSKNNLVHSNETTPPNDTSNSNQDSSQTPPLSNQTLPLSNKQPIPQSNEDPVGVVNDDVMGVVNQDANNKQKSMKSNKSCTNVLINDSNGRGSPQEDKHRRASLPAISPTEEHKSNQILRQKALEMMKTHGINKVTTFDETMISDETRKRLRKARKISQDTFAIKTTPPLPVRSMSGSRSDSKLINTRCEMVNEGREEERREEEKEREKEEGMRLNEGRIEDKKEEEKMDQKQIKVEDKEERKESTVINSQDYIKEEAHYKTNRQHYTTNRRHTESEITTRLSKSSEEKKKTVKANSRDRIHSTGFLPTAPSSRPSSAARRMAKQPPPQIKEDKKEEERKEERKDKERASDRPGDICISTDSTDSYQSVDSPLTWVNHEHDLHKDILLSQSDYVKTELTKLHDQLKPLEERAAVIERDIRDAMGQGDRDKEELLTVEYFKILNEKNVLIKKQIELNLLEKEEDLEKRQFFINRELRPLASIPDEEKTETQRQRELQLLNELVELVNERQWLDQRLTNTTSTNKEDSASPKEAPPTSHTSNSFSFSASTKARFSRDRAGSKDCVIS